MTNAKEKLWISTNIDEKVYNCFADITDNNIYI